MTTRVFSGVGGNTGTNSISVTSTSARHTLPARSTSAVLRVRNAGASDVYIAFGDNTVTATIPTAGGAGGGMPIGAGTVEVIDLPFTATNIAAIAATAGPFLFSYTVGEGV